jgi:uncharacterized repeat protein (TIGR02543 family)
MGIGFFKSSLIASVLLCASAVWAQPSGVNIGTKPQTYTLTVSRDGTGLGNVTGTGITCGVLSFEDCTQTFNPLTTVTLTAVAAINTGSTFTGWGGACSGSSATCDVLMTQAQSVTATFTFAGWVLLWDDNSSDEDNFELERRTTCTGGTYALLTSPIANAETYTDTTAVAGTQYEYRIRAVNTFGNSAYSTALCVP